MDIETIVKAGAGVVFAAVVCGTPLLLLAVWRANRSLAGALRASRDTERMDWIQANRAGIDTDGPGFVVYTDENEGTGLGDGASGGSFRNVRAAVDAAMRRQEAERSARRTDD